MLNMNTIDPRGLTNLAAAVIVDLAKSYLNARYHAIVESSPENDEAVYQYRNELLRTPWNLTGLSNEELIQKIELDGVAILDDRERKYA